jgi:hypothetical protein
VNDNGKREGFMKRFGKSLLEIVVVVGLFASASSAYASSSVVVTSVTGDVKVGREGAWKPAAKGTAISDTDFVMIPENATATIHLPDNTDKVFPGKAIIPGRRLSSTKTAAGAMIYFSQGLQKASEVVAGKKNDGTASNGAGKAGVTERPSTVFMSEGTTAPHVSQAQVAESDFRSGKNDAKAEADAILKDAKATSVEKRHAHLLLGLVAASTASYSTALKEFDAAATKAEDGDEAVLLRARALVQRGQVESQLSDDRTAKADFVEASSIAAQGSPEQAQAYFFLGVLAASANDATTARNFFNLLDSYPELKKAGIAMIDPPKAN